MSAIFRKRKQYPDGGHTSNRKYRRKYIQPRRYGPVVRTRPSMFPLYFADQPARKFARLKYVKVENTPSFTAGNIALLEYRANGMYDPEVALLGHQPYGFDQLMAQYQHFTVISATCTAEMLINDTNQNQHWRLFVYTTPGTPNTAFAAGGLNGMLEMPVQSQGVGKVTGDHLEQYRTIRTSCYVPKFAGKSVSGLIAESDYSGTDSADPVKQFYFGLVGWEPALGPGASTYLKVTVVYNAVFTDPRFFTTS